MKVYVYAINVFFIFSWRKEKIAIVNYDELMDGGLL
jgi:hypothetical protein